mgnify:CR=1 FL=1
MRSIGVFGGTFDPPHVAHLVLASEAQAQLGLDRVLWVLTPTSPHKVEQAITPVAVRLEMVRAAIQDDPVFEVSSVDLDRDPPYYAVDTMKLLQQKYPRAMLVYIMGEDSLRDLPKWHQPESFLQYCSFLGVMRRPKARVDLSRLAKVIPGIELKTRFIDIPLLQISSSDIRQSVARGDPFRYYLHEMVYHLVLKHHLYET